MPDPDPACTGAFRRRRVSALLQGGYGRRRAEERWRTRLLRAAYFLAPGEEAQTAIPCPRAAEDRRCTGRLRVRRFVDDLGLVAWSCPACGAAGELPGLDRLPTSALFPLAVPGVRPPAQEQRVRLEAEAYEALGELSYVLDGLSPSFDRARWVDGQVELPGPPAHLLELANLALRGASRARGRLARRLDEAAAVIERQVLPLNGPEGEEPDEELEEGLAALDLHSDLDSDEGGEKEPGGGAADAEQLEAALRALAGRPGGGFPHSLSVAPAPALTEASLRGIAHLLDSQTWSSPEEASAFLESAAAQAVLESVAHRFGDSPLDRAQALAYEAWEADPPRRYELAREALRLSEDCSDAWLILAETEERWQRRKRLFERALSAAAHALQVRDVPAEERTYANVFARPYVRAKVALARCLVEGRFLADAERLYLEMLRDDPDDPMGIRFELGQTYHHMAERSDAAGERGFEKLAQLLDAQEDDPDSWMRWERLWLALVRQARGLPGGSEEAVRKAFDLAFAANSHVPDFLLLREEPPATADAPFMALGSPEEAANYVFTAFRWWAAEPATLARLAELMEAKAGEREGDRGEAEDVGRAADDKRGR
ncbi:MAG: hypothetical protein IRZ26_09605 [Clostridia bacterium]|nr:hypothetical protein [Clostridia bacterium]